MRFRSLLFWFGFAVAVTACSKRTLPARGELLVLISSDMQVPDSFDTLILQLNEERGNLRHVYVLGQSGIDSFLRLNEKTPNYDTACILQEGDDIKDNLALPSTIGLQTSARDGKSSVLSVVACKNGRRLFTTDVPVTIPGEGEIRSLRLPIRWLCAERGPTQLLGCYTCESTRCYGESIHLDNSASSPCAVESCSIAADAYRNVEYQKEETSRYAKGSERCFNVFGCFSKSSLVLPQGDTSFPVAVDWRERPLVGSNASNLQCVAQVNRDEIDLNYLNLALVLPPNTQGTCTNAHCLVALEADSPLGYKVTLNSHEELLLPNAVCHLLDSGQVLSVIGSTACLARTTDTPVCGTKTVLAKPPEDSPTEESDFVPSLVGSFQFEEQSTTASVFVNEVNNTEKSGHDLSVVNTTSAAHAPRVSGVFAYGQTFDSQHFGKSQEDFPKLQGNHTIMFWVAVPEKVFDKKRPPAEATPVFPPTLPVLSYLDKSCASGFRVELLRCPDERSLQIAYGRPIGLLDGGQCALEWTYATLAEKSWRGGFFTPFKRGDYRHVAIRYNPGFTPEISIGGTEVTTTTTACIDNHENSILNDNSLLYVGSSRDHVENARELTAPIELDVLQLFDGLGSNDDIRQSLVTSSTKVGPGMLRWGAWATQGSQSILGLISYHKASAAITDKGLSSAGLFANLNSNSTFTSSGVDLRDFDEAVLYASIPYKTPFQFSISSEHGLRQCTWHLIGSESPYHVINLRQPSWCIDPGCSFDLSKVERASVGSDWTGNGYPDSSLSISALAFRKRNMADRDKSRGTPETVGGIIGLDNFCWRAVSYYPQFTVRLREENTGIDLVSFDSDTSNRIELAADLPATEDSVSARDFSQCSSINVTVHETLKTGTSFRLGLTNERGQTVSLPLSPQTSGLYSVDLTSNGFLWPESNEATDDLPRPTSNLEIAQNAVRLSLQYNGDFQVDKVQCCTDNGEHCQEIGKMVPPSASTIHP
jgi:hypothetical protein